MFLGDSDARPQGVVKLSALTAGKTYTFRLTGVDRDSQTSYAQVDLTVNEKPSSGSLSMSPSKVRIVNVAVLDFAKFYKPTSFRHFLH